MKQKLVSTHENFDDEVLARGMTTHVYTVRFIYKYMIIARHVNVTKTMNSEQDSEH